MDIQAKFLDSAGPGSLATGAHVMPQLEHEK